MAAKPISKEQIIAINTIAHKVGMDSDTLHALVESITGNVSIRALSCFQGIKVINRLKELAGQEPNNAQHKATKEQCAKIYALAGALGWDDPARLRSFLEKRYGVSHPGFLDDTKASNCIEAMKAMQKGGRAERRSHARE